MKIHYLKMQNYRQYADTKIKFSTDDTKRFTVLEGENGAGKTNILNAITWCLYGEERHLSRADSKRLPLVNEKIYHSLTAGQNADVKVEIGLGREEVEYVISRCATAYRRLDGDYSIVPDADPSVLFLARGNWKESGQPNVAVKSLLPENISPFFFFDGEHLDRFFQSDSAERVKRGIVDVSQIDLLELAQKHLARVNKDLMAKSTTTIEADKYKEEYQEAEDEHQKCKEKLDSLHKDLNGVQTNIDEISQKLRESPEEEVRDLQQERDILNTEIKDHEKRIDELIKEVSASLRRAGPTVYSYGALSRTFEIIQERIQHGELPPKVREPFFRDLLEKEICVCGTPLREGSETRQNVEARMASLSTEDHIKTASEGRYRLESLLNSVSEEIREQKSDRRDIRQYEEAIKENSRRLKEISEKVERFGEVNLQEIQVWEQQLKQFEEKKSQVNREIGAAEIALREAAKRRDEALKNYQKALKQDKKHRELLRRSQLCSNALTILEQIRQELLSETREKIQQKTEEYFLQLIWKKATYKSVSIDEDYRLGVENIRGLPSLGTLSAGERQVLALAFMAALRTISGFDAPIIIDTPTGRISSEPRENIAEVLPEYLKGIQATFLMTDTEYTDSVRVRLAKHVGKEYALEFNESEGVTHVRPI